MPRFSVSNYGGLDRLAHIEQFLSDQGAPFLSVADTEFAGGAKGDGVTNDTAAIQAAINALPQVGSGQPGGSGGTIYFPPGTYLCTGGLSVAGLKSIRFQGAGGQTPGDAPASTIIYSGTASRFINATGSYAFELDRMGVLYTSSSFTGTLIDASGGSFLLQCLDCIIGGLPTTAAILIDFDQGNYAVVNRCTIGGGQVGIRGVNGGASFSNVVHIRDSLFSSKGTAFHLTTAGIRNPGEAWVIDGCNFEPLHNNAPGALLVDQAVSNIGSGVTINGCWMGDATAGGTWINLLGGIAGLRISGNYISGGVGGCIGISTPTVPAQQGLVIQGNTFAILDAALKVNNNLYDLDMVGNVNGGSVTNQVQVAGGRIISGRYADWTTNHTVWFGGTTKSIQTPAFAASFTPDPSAGEIIKVGALTANITINAPASPVIGQSMTFMFTQDGTGGRTVTWNAIFVHSWSDTGNTLSKRSSIQFVYDGSNWVQVGAQRVWA